MTDNATVPNESRFKTQIRPLWRTVRRSVFDFRDWKKRAYTAPSPKAVKDQVLFRNAFPNATWVETGTFLGETTALLAKWGKKIYSLEPAEVFYARAVKRFAGQPHVTIINGPSEVEFATLLPRISGPVNFWLDGHFSAGATYQGEHDTPVMAELDAIAANMPALYPVAIMIDDIRCFDRTLPEYDTYPHLDSLIDWARQHELRWHIEHDILVMKSA